MLPAFVNPVQDLEVCEYPVFVNPVPAIWLLFIEKESHPADLFGKEF
jgi:hypothetical protein